MRHGPDHNMIGEWDDLRVLLEVARKGSFAGAAPGLDMVTATVRRRIDALEAVACVPLLDRATPQLAPTRAGAALVRHAEAMEAAAKAFMAEANRERDEALGLVRVASSEVIAQYLLTDVFTGLRQSHPGIAISLIAQNGPAAFDPEAADIGLVLIPPTADHVISAAVGQYEIGLFGRTDLLDRIGRPTHPEHLRQAPLAGAPDHPMTRDIHSMMGFREGDLTFRVRTDSFASQFAAVRSGMAIGACNAAFASQFDDIERVLPDHSLTVPLWLSVDAHQIDVLRVRIVRDAIAGAVATSAMAVSGYGLET
jgi:DNA-binding transcriptional LysR family regulator